MENTAAGESAASQQGRAGSSGKETGKLRRARRLNNGTAITSGRIRRHRGPQPGPQQGRTTHPGPGGRPLAGPSPGRRYLVKFRGRHQGYSRQAQARQLRAERGKSLLAEAIRNARQRLVRHNPATGPHSGRASSRHANRRNRRQPRQQPEEQKGTKPKRYGKRAEQRRWSKNRVRNCS